MGVIVGVGVCKTYQDHSIDKLLDKDLVPWNSTTNIELIGRVLLLVLGDLGGGQAPVQICFEHLHDIFNGKEEWGLRVFSGHCIGGVIETRIFERESRDFISVILKWTIWSIDVYNFTGQTTLSSTR